MPHEDAQQTAEFMGIVTGGAPRNHASNIQIKYLSDGKFWRLLDQYRIPRFSNNIKGSVHWDWVEM